MKNVTLKGIAVTNTKVFKHQEKILFGFNKVFFDGQIRKIIFEEELAKKALEQIKEGDEVKIEGECHTIEALTHEGFIAEFKEVFVQSFQLL